MGRVTEVGGGEGAGCRPLLEVRQERNICFIPLVRISWDHMLRRLNLSLISAPILLCSCCLPNTCTTGPAGTRQRSPTHEHRFPILFPSIINLCICIPAYIVITAVFILPARRLSYEYL
ncbi:hypothetical protein C8R42DRAFT_63565 [Lentinula raphanica]|nr:hypothetical protein C8R42DRAFT_63565 [Lentinula raphanica]